MSRNKCGVGWRPLVFGSGDTLAGAPNRAIRLVISRTSLKPRVGGSIGMDFEWEPGACVVSRIAHVGPGLDALLLDGFVSRWCIDYLGSTERGYSIAFRGGGRASRWIARAIGAQWPLAYETRGRGRLLDPRLLVWEGESLPAAADSTTSYDEFSQVQLRGAPLIIDQVGRRVPREVATVVDVRRDGRVIRVQERRGRDWKTLFKNVSVDDAEALEPVSLPHDDDYWSSNGQTDGGAVFTDGSSVGICTDRRLCGAQLRETE